MARKVPQATLSHRKSAARQANLHRHDGCGPEDANNARVALRSRPLLLDASI